MAQRWLAANPNPDEASIHAQAWDPSVKALVHYPDVLQMMSDNLDWTQALGAAFLNQQADVLESIQRLRLEAQVAGTLQSNQQQQVLPTGDVIEILPANPDVIYVPVYDPDVVYVPQPVYVAGSPPCISFGVGIRVGDFLDKGFDWNHHWIAVGGGWREGWQHDAHGWHQEAATWPEVDRGAPSPVLVTRAWARDTRKPAPVMPAPLARPNTYADHRGYPAAATPEMQRPAPLPIAVPRPATTLVRPAGPHPGPTPTPTRGEQPRPVTPAPGPTIHPTPMQVAPPRPVAPSPAPTGAPTHVEQPRPVVPGPAPTIHPTPIQVEPARPVAPSPAPTPAPSHVEQPRPVTPAPAPTITPPPRTANSRGP